MTLWRATAGFFLALAIAGLARRARSLSPSGAVAAVLVGTLAVAAGWRWGALLVAFFVSSTVLSHWRAATKDARTGGMVAKGGERDATQVLANGGVFAIAALLAVAGWDPAIAVGFGALAAAASDTWGTEIGTLASHIPRSIVTWRPVAPGTSGGVTAVGLAASLGGALFMAAVGRALGWPTLLAAAALAGGVAGSTTDSLVGALAQERRWCDRCDEMTERAVHSCGTPTRHLSGIAWLGNDGVNVACTLVGGAVAAAIWAL